MRQPNTVTIIADICENRTDELRNFLKQSVDVNADGHEGAVPFSKLGALHFCAMFIVERDELLDIAPILVIEATIDGDIREFLEEMVQAAPEAFSQIFSCCEGYPPSGMKLKRLVVDFLMLRLVKHKAHHCGYHGRTVSQIKAEQKLRDAITGELDQFNEYSTPSAPTSRALHRGLKAWLRSDDLFNWAVQKAEYPVTIRLRKLILFCLGAVVVLIPTILVSIWAYQFMSLSPIELWQLVANRLNAMTWIGAPKWPQSILNPNLLPFINLAFVIGSLSLLSYCFGFGSSALENYRNRHRKSFLNEMAVLAIRILSTVSMALLMLIIVYACFKLLGQLGVFASDIGYWQLVGLAVVLAIGVLLTGLIKSAVQTSAAKSTPNGLFATLLHIVVAAIGSLISAAYYVIMLSLILVGLCIAIWLIGTVLVGLQSAWIGLFGLFSVQVSAMPIEWFFENLPVWIHTAGSQISITLIALLVFLAAGLVLAAGLIAVLFSAARVLEFSERNTYQNCEALLGRDTSDARYAYTREEHGNNTHQNHLISVVHVKKGFLRLQILRFVLWIIEVLATYLFNLGTLGGIPTIMSARWVLIDNGTRLIFMTNYVGAWDSYINEFSDLEGVRGVNAIWSNTALPDPEGRKSRKLINFPLSSFLLWKGAENDQQFKAYIRASQCETLVWYGAYNTLSVSNINNNTLLRNTLFEQLSTAQLDGLAKRL